MSNLLGSFSIDTPTPTSTSVAHPKPSNAPVDLLGVVAVPPPSTAAAAAADLFDLLATTSPAQAGTPPMPPPMTPPMAAPMAPPMGPPISAPSAAAAAAVLLPGQRVTLVGLKNRPELIGCEASIVSFDAARERYSVMLNGGVVALKRVNLQP